MATVCASTNKPCESYVTHEFEASEFGGTVAWTTIETERCHCHGEPVVRCVYLCEGGCGPVEPRWRTLEGQRCPLCPYCDYHLRRVEAPWDRPAREVEADEWDVEPQEVRVA